MMTRKDYVKVATILNDIAKPNMDMIPFEDLVTEFGQMRHWHEQGSGFVF